MAIAQLIETLDAGGAEALAVDIANDLAARGLDSHLIVVDGGGCFQDRLDDSVHLHDLNSPRCTTHVLARGAYFLRTARVLSRIVSDHGIEVIQSHLPKANFFGLAQGMLHGSRVLATVHNNREFEYGDDRGGLVEWGRRFAYGMMLRFGAGMIAVSTEVKAAMEAELGVSGKPIAKRIVAVPNGVSCPERPLPDIRREIRSNWKVDDEDVLLLGAGRLTRQKNFGALVNALIRIGESGPSWRCVIAGDGELRGDLEKQIEESGRQERIVLAGHVDRLRDLMGAADVFCLSSIYEGLPLVMLEAMAAGLPVCAFGIRGASDVVTHEREGLLAEPENVGDFAKALEKLIASETLRCELGDAGRRLVRESYSFEAMVDTLVSLYGGRRDRK